MQPSRARRETPSLDQEGRSTEIRRFAGCSAGQRWPLRGDRRGGRASISCRCLCREATRGLLLRRKRAGANLLQRRHVLVALRAGCVALSARNLAAIATTPRPIKVCRKRSAVEGDHVGGVYAVAPRHLVISVFGIWLSSYSAPDVLAHF